MHRTRVRNALRHITPDRTPVDFGGMIFSCCEQEFLQDMRKVLGFERPDDRDAWNRWVWVDEQIMRALDVDLRWVPHEPPLVQMKDWYPERVDEAAARQAALRRDKKGQTPNVRHAFPYQDLTLEQIRAIEPELTPPNPYLDWMIATAKAYRADGYPTTAFACGGYFEMACWKRGYDQIAMDMALEPDLVRALFDTWLEEKKHLIEVYIKPLAPYIDIFVFGDDLGMQSGPFMSPEMFRDLIKPYMRETYAAVHAAAPDSFIMHHSCGSIYALLDDLIDTGIDVMNPTQPNAKDMTPTQLKERAGGRIAFHGGMDLQDLLPHGTPEEVRTEAETRMRRLGEGGGYICAPAHTLPDDVPVENIIAMCSADRGDGPRRAGG
jgi:uroporphyrinogen decarboxylase